MMMVLYSHQNQTCLIPCFLFSAPVNMRRLIKNLGVGWPCSAFPCKSCHFHVSNRSVEVASDVWLGEAFISVRQANGQRKLDQHMNGIRAILKDGCQADPARNSPAMTGQEKSMAWHEHKVLGCGPCLRHIFWEKAWQGMARPDTTKDTEFSKSKLRHDGQWAWSLCWTSHPGSSWHDTKWVWCVLVARSPIWPMGITAIDLKGVREMHAGTELL